MANASPSSSRKALKEALAALKLAERWLVNCLPIVDVPGPKPLPVLRAAMTRIEAALKKEQP